jgi:hypothetical protein
VAFDLLLSRNRNGTILHPFWGLLAATLNLSQSTPNPSSSAGAEAPANKQYQAFHQYALTIQSIYHG